MNPNPIIKVFVQPGCVMPVQGRKPDDIGYDACIRAIVTSSMDKQYPHLHDTVWDFQNAPPIQTLPRAKILHHDRKWKYRLGHHERILLGLGVVFGGPSKDWYVEVAARSSLAMKVGWVNLFDRVPVDPNFRGELMANIINFGMDPLELYKDLSLVQFVFHCRCCQGRGFLQPILEQVSTIEELGITDRGTQWNNSSASLKEKQAAA